MYYKPFYYDRMSLLEKRYQLQHPGIVKPIENQTFCKSLVLYTNPNGAPDDEVAMVCVPSGCGIMMEWERPISALSFYFIPLLPFLIFRLV
jgi:hypothetical protein